MGKLIDIDKILLGFFIIYAMINGLLSFNLNISTGAGVVSFGLAALSIVIDGCESC